MKWHRLVWDRLLAIDHGKLAYRQGLISTARQNGKSWALEMLCAWWLLERALTHGPQNAAWVSHDLRLSEQSFLRLARLLEPWTEYRSNSFGRQRLELTNGSTLAVQSNTPGSGHGNTYHLVVADEVWKLRPEAISLGLGPTQRAVREPLMALSSTAGDEGSTLLRSLRERALTAIETAMPGPLVMLEWSMPPNADPFDARLWGDPNPCLGTTLDAETLISESQGDRSSFLRGSLNIWTSSAACWLQPGAWDRCLMRKPPEPTGGVLACEISMSGERFSAVRSFQHNGVSVASVLTSTEDEAQFWDAVAEVYPAVDALAITPTLEIHLPEALKRKTTTVGLRELSRWVPTVRNMIHGGQVAHAPSALLDEHVSRAVATKSAGLSTAHSSGEISLARCLTWAVAMSSRPATSRRPAVAVAKAAG